VGDHPRPIGRTREGYSLQPDAAKRVFVRPLHAQAQACPVTSVLDPQYRHGAPRIMLSAEHMGSLPDFFADIPTRAAARDGAIPCPPVLAIAAGATLCGMRGYKAISLWAEDLARRRGHAFAAATATVTTPVPSRTVIREVLTRVDPARWTAPPSLERPARRDRRGAGHRRPSTMCNAIDAEGRQPTSSASSATRPRPATPKKRSAPCP